jgi:hypothetical protein
MQAHCIGFFQLLAPVNPLLCTGDNVFIPSENVKNNVQMFYMYTMALSGELKNTYPFTHHCPYPVQPMSR